jgi:acyl-CoA reductase-like NAD-dependent aldehyde dehydrogenase
LIDMKAVEKVEAHIADAAKKRAKVVTSGEQNAFAGTFFEPTVLTANRQRGSSRNVVGRTSARTIDCA